MCYFLLASGLVETFLELPEVLNPVLFLRLKELGTPPFKLCFISARPALSLTSAVPFSSRLLEQVLQLGAGLAAASGLASAWWIPWSHMSA